MDSDPNTTQAAKGADSSSARSGGVLRRMVLGVAWIAIWFVTFAVSAEVGRWYFSDWDVFAYWLSRIALTVFAPLGFCLSYVAARKTRRLWPFFAGAPVTCTSTVVLLAVVGSLPLESERDPGIPEPARSAIGAVIRSAPRAPLEGRAPEDRLLRIIGSDRKQGLIDTQGRIVLEPVLQWTMSSSEGRAMVSSPGQDLLGFVDGTGRIVIEPRWHHVSSFTEGLCMFVAATPRPERTLWQDMGFAYPAHVQTKQGYIDRDGNVVIAARFTNARPFSGGVAWVSTGERHGDDERWGLIDRSGAFLIPPSLQWEPPSFSEGLCPIWQDAEWSEDESVERFGYIDTHGATVISPRFRGAGSFAEGLAPVVYGAKGVPGVKGGKLGFIDHTGELVIPAQFEWGYSSPGIRPDWPVFSEGLAPVSIGGRYGFIDKSGRIAIEPRFQFAQRMSDGLALIRVDGKSGFIDKSGHMIIPPQFDDADSFDNGIARVEVSRGIEGYIRRDGSFVWNPLLASPR